MAFGQELKDFVSGFTTGYNLIESKEDKEWKREERQMKRDDHQYRRDRDAIDDERWNKGFDWRVGTDQRDFDYRVGNDQRDHNYRVGRAARSDLQWDEEQKGKERDRLIEEARLKRLAREKSGGDIPDEVDAAPEYGIPDGAQQNRAPSSSAPGVDPTKTSSVTPRGNEWLRYSNASATRNQPLSPRLEKTLAKIAPQLGIEVEVFSGGQSARGRRRTGSHRHDHGDAADVFFYKDGRKLDWANPKDRPIFEKIVQLGKAEGLTGFGAGNGYMRRGSMHLGYGEPAVWGRGGSGKTAAPWLVSAYNGRYARGGMVEAIPTDEEEQPEDTSLFTIAMADEPEQAAQPETALPEDGPIPTPRYDGEGVQDDKAASGKADDAPTDDPYETAYRAAREGLNRAMQLAKADAQTAIDDPEMNKYLDRFARGYGAAPQQVIRQMIDKIDPEKKMPAGQRNMLAMANAYRFFWDRGEPEKAKEAAASLIQYYNQSFQQFSALAKAAGENGDMDNAIKAATAAYAQIPNGRDLQVAKNEDGTLTVKVTDEKSGKEIANHVMPPEQLLAEAMNFSPKTFYDELMNAAGVPAEKYDDASLEDMSKVSDNIRATIEADFADSGLTKEGMAGIEDIATDIAKFKQGISPSQAVRLAAGLLAASPDEISVKEERGNPDLAQVKFGGHKFVISKGQLGQIINAHKERAAKQEAGNKKGEESAKKTEENLGYVKDFVKVFSEELSRDDAPTASGIIGDLFGSSEAEANTAIPEDNSEEERMRALDDYLGRR